MYRPVLSVCAIVGFALGTIPPINAEPPEDKARIEVAVKNQEAGNYKADRWECVWLKQGDLVYSGLPGQTQYYTTHKSLDGSGKSAPKLWESLQVAPHVTFGYRVQVMEYTVMKDIRVPYGKCKANAQYGDGGGEQYFIADFATVLKKTDKVTNLTDGGSDNLSKVRPAIKKVVGINQ